MRWLVEVSAIGKGDPQSFCVEADSWQRALQIVRSHRGEPSAMNGFSIELLEEGYRAVDPVARLRFVVKRAPEGTALSPIEMAPGGSQAPHKNDSKAPGAVIAPAPRAPDANSPAPAAAPPAAAAAPGSGKVPPAAESKPKAGPPRPGAGASGPYATSTAKADPPKAPEGLPTDGAPTVEIAKAPATTNGASAQPPKTNGPVTLEMSTRVPPQALPSQPQTEPSPTVVAPQPVGAPLPNLPPFTVLSKREEHPSPSAPLSYREYVFVVPPGTVEGTAVQILLGQLELVQGALGSEKPGKLVQLAAFDETYTGKPPRPPLATLVWKDWRGEPVVSFPRRASVAPPGSKPTPSSTVPSLKPASVPPKATLLEPKTTLDDTRALHQRPDVSFAPPDTEVTKTAVDLETAKTVETPVFQGPKGAPTMLGIPTQAFGSPAPASPSAASASSATGAIPATSATSPSSGFGPNTQASQPPAPVPAAAPVAPAVPGPTASAAPAPAPAVVTTAVVSIPAAPAAQAPAQVSKSVPPPAAAPAPQVAKSIPPPAPAPAPQVAKSVPPPAAQGPAPQVSKSVPPPAADPTAKTLPVGQGPTGILPPAPAGVLGVEKAPDFTPPPGHASSMRLPVAKPGGRVSGDELIGALFEAMHDLHFLRDAIEGAEFCLQLANEAIPSRASFAHFYDMEKREFVLVRTSGRDTKPLVGKRHLEGEPLLAAAVKARRAVVRGAEDAMSNRYTTVGGAKSLVVAPVFVAGRALAVLEIVDALDGAPFTQDEANAMNYIAEQFAEFLSSRGVVLDQARIQLGG